jgi:hypothetical protein
MKEYWSKLKKPLFVCCGFLYFLALTSSGNAATVLELDLEQLITKSDLIVVATVAEQSSHWNKYGRIVTEVVLEVQQTLKGQASEGEELTVTTLGGRVGDVVMKVDGSPRFIGGASILVFLREVPALGQLQVVGMSQGLRYLSDGPFGRVILPGGEGLALIRPDQTGEPTKNQSTVSDDPAASEPLLVEVNRMVADLSPE